MSINEQIISCIKKLNVDDKKVMDIVSDYFDDETGIVFDDEFPENTFLSGSYNYSDISDNDLDCLCNSVLKHKEFLDDHDFYPEEIGDIGDVSDINEMYKDYGYEDETIRNMKLEFITMFVYFILENINDIDFINYLQK